MSTVNVTNFRKDLFAYLNSAIEYNDVINVSTKNGNVVVLNEEEYRGLLETLYLLSIPQIKERLEEGIQITAEECDDFEW